MTAALPWIATLCVAFPQQSEELRRALDEIEQLKLQNASLAEKVGALEERIVDSQNASWLTEARAQEIRGIVTDVLADASARTSSLEGATAGFDAQRGFFLASADGNYSLVVKGEMQIRWALDDRDIPNTPAAQGSVAGGVEAASWGFEARRTRLDFSGNLVDPSWKYDIKIAMTNGGSIATLDDAWVDKNFGNGLSMRVGQFKSSFLRELVDAVLGTLAAERSLVHGFFTTGRVQGARLTWEDEHFRIDGLYTSGIQASGSEPYSVVGGVASPLNAAPSLGLAGSQNRGFGRSLTDYAFMARAEWKPTGEWKQFRDQSSFRGEQAGTLFGVAGYIEQVLPVGGTNGATPDVMWSGTADAKFDFGGSNIFAYGVYRNVQLQSAQATRGGGSNDSLHQWGAMIQGGYFIADAVEAFARYEAGFSDTDQYRTQASALLADADTLSLVTAGLNWWPAGTQHQQIKVTADFGYAFTPVIDFANVGANWQADYTAAGGESNDGQWVVRTQLQFYF